MELTHQHNDEFKQKRSWEIKLIIGLFLGTPKWLWIVDLCRGVIIINNNYYIFLNLQIANVLNWHGIWIWPFGFIGFSPIELYPPKQWIQQFHLFSNVTWCHTMLQTFFFCNVISYLHFLARDHGVF